MTARMFSRQRRSRLRTASICLARALFVPRLEASAERRIRRINKWTRKEKLSLIPFTVLVLLVTILGGWLSGNFKD